MGVELSDDEVRDFLRTAHTGIFTSLRADGWPVSLPMWFVALDDAVYVRTPAKARKVARVRADGRVSFVIESGKAWKELRGVVITGRAVLVEDPAERGRVSEALGSKYEGFGVARESAPEATKSHYAGRAAVIRIEPTGPPLSWDNAKIRMRSKTA